MTRTTITNTCQGFIDTWNQSATLREVAEKTERSKFGCRTEAVRLRKIGAILKYMPRECSSKDEGDRFWDYVEKTDTCWLWIGATNTQGYGQINSRRGKKRIAAHRLSYKIHHGEIAENLEVCHTCDNTICVNPAHLFLGTHKQNMEDMVSKERNFRCNVTLDEAIVIKAIQLRLENNLSYSSISAITGISPVAVWKIVNGKAKSWVHLIPSQNGK